MVASLEAISLVVGLASGVLGGVLTATKFAYDLKEKERNRLLEAGRKEFAAETEFVYIKRELDMIRQRIEFVYKDYELRLKNLELEFAQIRVKLEVLLTKIEDTE